MSSHNEAVRLSVRWTAARGGQPSAIEASGIPADTRRSVRSGRPPDARFPGLEDISVLLLPDQSDPLTCHVHGLLSVAGHDEAQINWQRATCVSARGARSACIGGAGGHGALTMECARSHRLAMSASPAYRDPRSSVEAAESRLNPGVFSECRGTFGGYKYQRVKDLFADGLARRCKPALSFRPPCVSIG